MTINQRTMNEDNLFAITSSASYVNQALEEAREVDKELKILKNYGNGILLASTKMDRESFNEAMINKKPIFIRHISAFDMMGEVSPDTTPIDIARHVEAYKELIIPNRKIAVQVRKASGEYYFNPVDIKTQIDLILQEAGAQDEIKEPEFVISILLDQEIFYMGMNSANLNLSSWSGGMLHYKKDEADISRAKFKLMEAISVFELDFANIHHALDLGAAPGGWTSVLLERNIAVTAVDTGDMDERLNKYKNYKYLKENAAEIELPEESFDLLTSDISWNAKNTAALVNRAAKFLKSDGYAIVTVKLMGDKIRKTIREVKEIYQEVFDVVSAKQLFHNRDEITLLLRKRS